MSPSRYNDNSLQRLTRSACYCCKALTRPGTWPIIFSNTIQSAQRLSGCHKRTHLGKLISLSFENSSRTHLITETRGPVSYGSHCKTTRRHSRSLARQLSKCSSVRERAVWLQKRQFRFLHCSSHFHSLDRLAFYTTQHGGYSGVLPPCTVPLRLFKATVTSGATSPIKRAHVITMVPVCVYFQLLGQLTDFHEMYTLYAV